MNTSGNTILITGGSSGIGLAMAEALVGAGNEVLVCGRSDARLEAARQRIPTLRTLACDVGRRDARDELFRWATTVAPSVNILINNAGVQRETDFAGGAAPLWDEENEIDINLKASIELAASFVPYFLKSKQESAVVNVTSGLAFIPIKTVPVYCATKAALHSFSMSLRSQLVDTNVRVFEIIPPIVDTGLHRGERARELGQQGLPAERIAAALLKMLAKNRDEMAVGRAKDLVFASRIAPRFFHRLLNKAVS